MGILYFLNFFLPSTASKWKCGAPTALRSHTCICGLMAISIMRSPSSTSFKSAFSMGSIKISVTVLITNLYPSEFLKAQLYTSDYIY